MSKKPKRYTDKQGQYLAFIYYYTKVNGIAPAEADMQRYFRVTTPSVHQMVLTLAKKGLITRSKGVGPSEVIEITEYDIKNKGDFRPIRAFLRLKRQI